MSLIFRTEGVLTSILDRKKAIYIGNRLTSILDMPSPKKAHASLTWAI